MLRSKWLAVVLLAVAAAVAIAVGCGRRDGDDTTAPPIDTEVMAFLSEARALHHQANLKEDSGDLAGAIASMERLVSARRPHPERPAPEVSEVLADAYARLAELELKRHGLAAATKAVESGLAYAQDATYFRGHLLEVQGLIIEASAADLADAGKKDEADREREKAIQLLEEVVRIQEDVIQRSLAARDAGGEPWR